MGGKSTASSQTTESSQTNPWAPTQGLLGNIINQLGTASNNTGLTGSQSGALDTITNNSNAAAGLFGPQQSNYAQSLYNGGGALNQAGGVQSAYDRYVGQTMPLASNTNYNPYDTPGFRDAINTATSDITNNINGSFAAAGRDFSGMNAQTLARGLAQGLAPTIAAQYNQNVQNQQGASGNLYNAGNTNAGILSGLQQQYLTNQGAGLNAASGGLDLSNAGANATLQAEAQRFGIPIQNLGLLANIGIPIAGLGGQSTGQRSSTSEQNMSGAQQFATIASGLGSLFGGGGGSTAGNIIKLFG